MQTAASRDASKLLAETWIGLIPIDPVRIARRIGLRVIDAELNADTFGALVKRAGDDATIMINAADSPHRRRFTCAHEIGHYVKRTDEADEYTTVDLRSGLSARGTDQDEIYANEFAACLLMPEGEVLRLHREGFSDWEMALQFVVSREAIRHRLKKMRLSV